jgi:hypothetical protein
MINEDTLNNLVKDIDESLATLMAKHQLGPLLVGSVTLARLMLSNDHMGSGEEFRKLLIEAADKRPHNPELAVH